MMRIVETKKRMGKDFNEALMALAEANFAAGDFAKAVFDSVKTKTSMRLSVEPYNVAGVHMPTFELKGDTDDQSDDQ